MRLPLATIITVSVLNSLLPGQACANRTPIKINGSGESRIIDAKLSPDGLRVAYMDYDISGVSLLMRNSDGSSTSSTLITSVAGNPVPYFPNFTWNMQYYNGSDRPSVVFVHKTALGSHKVRGYNVISNTTWTLLDLPAGTDYLTIQENPFKHIYCGVYRQNSTYYLFYGDVRVGQSRTNVASSSEPLFPLDVDPTEQRLMYTRRTSLSGSSFGHDLRLCTLGGAQIPIISTSTSLTTRIYDGAFADDAQNAFFSYTYTQFVLPSYFASHYTQGSPNPGWIDLSNNAFESFENLSITPSHLQQTARKKTWLVASGDHQLSGTAQDRLAMLPVEGGGEVLVVRGYPHVEILQPTIDRDAQRIAFRSRSSSTTSSTDLYVVNTDREIRASPKSRIGSSFKVELPSAVGELCGLFVSEQRTTPFPIAPFCGFFELAQPVETLFLLAGTGKPLVTKVQIPNNSAFVGLKLVYQGIRSLGDAGGDITRPARVRIHN